MGCQHNEAIADYKKEVEKLSTQIDRLNETLSAAQKQNNVQQSLISTQHKEILEKNLKIESLKQQLTASERAKADDERWAAQIAERDTEIEGLKKELDEAKHKAQVDVHWAHQSREMLIEELRGDIRNAKQQVADYQRLSEAESERASLLHNILTTKAMAERYSQNLPGLHLALGHAESIAAALHAKLKTQDGDCDESN